eukprot:COSAG01_NODE_308_length_19148_cov_13.076697_10_plen_110_part_00
MRTISLMRSLKMPTALFMTHLRPLFEFTTSTLSLHTHVCSVWDSRSLSVVTTLKCTIGRQGLALHLPSHVHAGTEIAHCQTFLFVRREVEFDSDIQVHHRSFGAAGVFK